MIWDTQPAKGQRNGVGSGGFNVEGWYRSDQENNLTMNGLTYLANSNGFYWEVSLVMRAIFQQEGPTQLEQVSKC